MRWLIALSVLAGAFTCNASQILVTFETAVIEGGTPTTLPVFMAGFPDPNKIRLRFQVPNAADIVSINSLSVDVAVYDDGDSQTNEVGSIQFVLAEIGLPNIELATFGPGFNGTNSTSPLLVSGSANFADFPDILNAIQNDGVFFLRVNRDGGDFYLASGTVSLDATTPEPATFLFAATGLAACALIRFRRQVGSASGLSIRAKLGRHFSHIFLFFFPVTVTV